MGRYSSVQAYADSNSNMRSVSYAQATGSSEVKKGTVKAEKVSNPYGSTAGAGSGEFHVYRHARSRELERWKKMDEDEKQDRLDQEFEDNRKRAAEETLSKTDKNRKKRQRQKEAKLRKKNLQLSGVAAAIVREDEDKKRTNAKSDGNKNSNEEEEFSYTPMKLPSEGEEKKAEEPDSKPPAIPNDGSFLERMKAQMAASAAPKDNPETASETTKTED